MGRKPKCTVEEKISAVEDYLNGIRSVSEIMIDLSIKSTRTIRNWILAYQNGGIEALCSVTANHSYSSEFKIEMVRKYINGEGSVTDLCARYGIPSLFLTVPPPYLFLQAGVLVACSPGAAAPVHQLHHPFCGVHVYRIDHLLQ